MKSFIISCFLSLVILTVIYKTNHDPGDTSLKISNIYSAANDTLAIDSGRFVLETYLFRAAKENGKESEKDLVALVYLVNTINLQIYTNVSVINLYIIKDKNIWTSYTGSTGMNESQFSLARVSTEGPTWETGIFVDVVAEIRVDSTDYSIIARHQTFEGLK